MATISLLDFFRTGQFGDVKVGMTKTEVLARLGVPDRTWDHLPLIEASIWIYDVVELYWVDRFWTGFDTHLSSITFQPWRMSFHDRKGSKLHRDKQFRQIDYWIFRERRHLPLKQLKFSLRQKRIPFQDTGLETLVYHNNSRRKWILFEDMGLEIIAYQEDNKTFTVVPFLNAPANYDSDDVFGTLVLKSGVQVRYLENYEIETIAIQVKRGNNHKIDDTAYDNSPWTYKGSERFIRW